MPGRPCARKPASQEKCSAAFSAETEAAGSCSWTADRVRDLADGDAFVGDGVEGRSRGGAFQREPEQPCGVEPVHRRPAVASVADVAGEAFLAGDADEGRHEAVVAVAVHGRGEADARRSGRRVRRGRA